MIPLILRLKKATHREIAKAQDLIVQVLYKEFDNAVLHGGTAIWRCYNGNRFSEDVDAYINKDDKNINAFFRNLEAEGFLIKKKKISKNSIFSVMQFNRIVVRFEALFIHKSGFLKEYEAIDGSLITVYTLTPEELINEKIGAYLKRFKIRDLYDVFFLLRFVKDKDEVICGLKSLNKKFKPPVDKEDLKVLIFEGLIPDTEKMLSYIKRWIS